VVVPESSTWLGNCSDTTSHLITRSHVESGQSPRIKHAVLYSAALYGLRVFLTDCKSSASSSHPQPSDGDINGAMLAATAVAVTLDSTFIGSCEDGERHLECGSPISKRRLVGRRFSVSLPKPIQMSKS
jgi:hypothetical protein